jgi:hypothetical protein
MYSRSSLDFLAEPEMQHHASGASAVAWVRPTTTVHSSILVHPSRLLGVIQYELVLSHISAKYRVPKWFLVSHHRHPGRCTKRVRDIYEKQLLTRRQGATFAISKHLRPQEESSVLAMMGLPWSTLSVTKPNRMLPCPPH